MNTSLLAFFQAERSLLASLIFPPCYRVVLSQAPSSGWWAPSSSKEGACKGAGRIAGGARALPDLWDVFQGGLELPAKLPVLGSWRRGEAGCLKSAGAFPLILPRLGSAPGFWEGLSEPPRPAARAGINAGRRG